MRRRTFLLSTLATAAQLHAQPSAPSSLVRNAFLEDTSRTTDFPKLPKTFRWGVATSAYQIEGGVHEGGRGESIWDRFCHTPGRIKTGETANIACDHFHLWKSDIAMMKSLGIQSYRFSLAWPRFQPTGSGHVNQHGIDFYSRIIDELLAQGIHPLPTLYHWDLPQALQDRGGWASRETADRFAEYAHIVTRAYADRCHRWLIFNEPSMFVNLGHLSGIHAPGIKDPALTMRAGHIVNLAQAKAFRAMKTISPKLRIGSAFSMSQPHPATDSEQDRLAAERFHAWENVWFLEPALHGRYPAAVGATPEKLLDIRPGDMEQIRAPFDFIGINNYSFERGDTVFIQSFVNTMSYTVITTIFKLGIGLVMALLLNQVFPAQRFVRAALLLPWIIPSVLSTLAWRWMFDPTFSVINWALVHGLHGNGVNWLGTTNTALASLMVVNTWRGIPFYGISFLAGLQTIPVELYEAARVDGASRWQQFRSITIPMLRPILVVVLLLSTILTFGDFTLPYVLTNCAPYNSTCVLSTWAFQIGVNGGYIGIGAAISLVLFPLLSVIVAGVLIGLRRER